MADENTTVFLEDIEAKSSTRTSKPDASGSAGGTKPKQQTSTTTLKRQRTLMDNSFFAPPAKKDGTAEPALKKPKLAANASSSSVTSSPTKTASGVQTLNSIPFSVSAFIESLTDEQKRLLRLEIECMNKTW